MADLSLVTDNYFTVASETFTDNLSSSISAGAATVPVNNNSEYTNGDCVVLTVDPGTVNEATFIGKKSGLNFIECVWTEGNTAVGHSNGATIIDYDSATHHSAQSKGIQQFANDDGTLKTQPVRDALGLTSSAANGWEVSPYTFAVTTGYNNGNRSFSVTVANNDLTDEYSQFMRFKFTRNTAAPTQCADLEASSSQYASKTTPTGVGQTDDMSVECWVKPESLAATMGILSTANGTTNGFNFYLTSVGKIVFGGARAADDYVTSNQAVEVGKWQHIAATIDSSGATGTAYINGISVPVTYTNGANSAFLATTSNLVIGATNAAAPTNFFDGKLSDLRYWSVVRTQLQIRDNMYQQLVGTETNLAGYWKLAGNFNDSTANANNATGSGGAVATNVDAPFKDTEIAMLESITYSAPNTTLVFQTPEGFSIPNMTLTQPYYSAQYAPYGWTNDPFKWEVVAQYQPSASATYTNNTWYNIDTARLSVPVGSFNTGYDCGQVRGYATMAAPTFIQVTIQMSETAANTGTQDEQNRWRSLTGKDEYGTGGTNHTVNASVSRYAGTNYSTATLVYLNYMLTTGGTSGSTAAQSLPYALKAIPAGI